MNLILISISLCFVLVVLAKIISFMFLFYVGLCVGLLLTGYYFYKKYKEKYNNEQQSKEPFVLFNFLNDAQNVAQNPEIYCGTDVILPEEYDIFGTRNRCLRKGVGIGMSMSDDAVIAALVRPPPVGPRPRIYCGNNDILPDGYDQMGTPYLCLRKGVGTGIHLPLAQRRAFQQTPPRPLGKKEIMTLSKRLGINTNNRTRAQSLQEIRQHI